MGVRLLPASLLLKLWAPNARGTCQVLIQPASALRPAPRSSAARDRARAATMQFTFWGNSSIVQSRKMLLYVARSSQVNALVVEQERQSWSNSVGAGYEVRPWHSSFCCAWNGMANPASSWLRPRPG